MSIFTASKAIHAGDLAYGDKFTNPDDGRRYLVHGAGEPNCDEVRLSVSPVTFPTQTSRTLEVTLDPATIVNLD